MHFDAVIAGGGVAGSTTGAALARQGLRVLVCEKSLPSIRRLAGELMHPPAAAGLDGLGLLRPLVDQGAVPVYGFAVFRDARDSGTLLSYTEVRGCRPAGVAIEHGVMTRTLLQEVAGFQNVTVWDDARVEAADVGSEGAVVTIRRGADELTVFAGLVVSAEGRASRIREQGGIECREGEPFRMVGFKVPGARLPLPGYGHLFIGGPTAVLAYQVEADAARIMFELGLDDGLDIPGELMDALPRPFRDDVQRAIGEQPRQTARFCGLTPNRYTAPRMAIVGDAGGCVHPLIASGISFCVGDAVRLGEAVARQYRAPADVPAVLARYDRSRRGPMRTRVALGPALVDALTGDTPEMRLLRHGLFRYWGRSTRGRGISMGLLSTHRSSMTDMMWEYSNVCLHALTAAGVGVVPTRQFGRWRRDAIRGQRRPCFRYGLPDEVSAGSGADRLGVWERVGSGGHGTAGRGQRGRGSGAGARGRCARRDRRGRHGSGCDLARRHRRR